MIEDNTYDLAGIDQGAYLPYYAGTPTNPRFVVRLPVHRPGAYLHRGVRLVSNTNPDNLFDYVVGLFYEKQDANRCVD